MRRRKQKHLRRALRFYKINHGFRAPFKVLVDGNFVNAILTLKRGDVEDLVPQFLGEKSRILITRCCLEELRKLGSEVSDARRACKKFAVHHCGHEESVSASECLLDQVREGNHEHFFVATQDRNLQQKISNKPAGAVMFATVNGIQMEMPSEKQKHHVSKSAEEKLLPGILEIQNNMVSSSSRSQNQFKRRKAKGPNPLSMKKKKGEGATIPDTTTAEGAPAKKAKRMRKSRALIQEETT